MRLFIITLHELFTPAMVGGLLLKSLQVSRTSLSILSVLNNAVILMNLILPLISNSFSLFSKLAQSAGTAEYTNCREVGLS